MPFQIVGNTTVESMYVAQDAGIIQIKPGHQGKEDTESWMGIRYKHCHPNVVCKQDN